MFMSLISHVISLLVFSKYYTGLFCSVNCKTKYSFQIQIQLTFVLCSKKSTHKNVYFYFLEDKVIYTIHFIIILIIYSYHDVRIMTAELLLVILTTVSLIFRLVSTTMPTQCSVNVLKKTVIS